MLAMLAHSSNPYKYHLPIVQVVIYRDEVCPSKLSVTIQIFHFCLIWLRFYFYFYKGQNIMLCIYSRKCAILKEEVIRNGNRLGLWNKIKSNKNRINN